MARRWVAIGSAWIVLAFGLPLAHADDPPAGGDPPAGPSSVSVPDAGPRDGTAAATPEEDLRQVLRAAERVRRSVVRVQWRGRTGGTVERHAVVVDRDGWLVMAGLPPGGRGSLVVVLEKDRAVPAEVWASDPETCVSLVHAPVGDLEAVTWAPQRPFGGNKPRIGRSHADPGQPLLMVTADGAVARGAWRAPHRHRVIEGPSRSGPTEVTCLDEAALTVVPTDLGAPWVDLEGRVIGLLVGADVAPPVASLGPPGELRMRPEVVAAYAIPAGIIETVWPLLRDDRRVPRAAMGVLARPLSEAARRHFCPTCGGFEILEVAEDGAAGRAGIRNLDILRSIDGAAPVPGASLGDLLLQHRPGDVIRLGLVRRGEPIEVDVVLGGAAPR